MDFRCRMTDRIAHVRRQYLRTPIAQRDGHLPATYGNHPTTLHWLEGYLEAKDELTTLLRRSRAEEAEMDRSKVIIMEDELIVGQPDFEMTEAETVRRDELFRMFRMAPSVSGEGRSDHMALDYRKLLRMGVDGLIAEIEEKKSQLTFSPETIGEDFEKDEFYDACLIELHALIRYAARYEARLRELAVEAVPGRKEELLTMADNLAQVPKGTAKTFWQALQSMHFFTFTLRGLYSAGRPDQELIDYYHADIEAGRLTKEFAQELIDNFCLTYASYVSPNTAAGMMLGGTDENGNFVENDLTWMFLIAVDHIRMPDPNVGLCITEQTDAELLCYAFDMIGRGCTFPSFWNDAEVVRSLKELGFPERDARRYINSTCVELTIIGKSAMWTACPYHNLAQLLMEIFMEGNYPDYESLEKAFFARVRRSIAEGNAVVNRAKLERARIPSEAMRHSCLVDDCIGRGRHVGNGGAVYNETLPNTLGFANSVDALSAIRELVYERGEITLEEYRKAVSCNYEGYEALRQRILHRTPHYGNGDDRVDGIAAALADCLIEGCRSERTLHGSKLIPGIFSYNYHVLYGADTPATPDGRLAGMPLSDSAGPAQGRDTESPTAALRSGTSWHQGDFLGGVAQNIRLDKRYFASPGMEIPIALLRAFFARGGCELQFNCVDDAVLKDAVEHPELHEDLLVRVGGYSDYFVRLPEKLQKEIMDRTNY